MAEDKPTENQRKLRSARIDCHQASFFPPTPEGICQKLGVNWFALESLRAQGFLSFEPLAAMELDATEEAEIVFLASLVSAGCDKRMLDHLLGGLEKPYIYCHRKLYFDWMRKEWQLTPEFPDEEEVTRAFIESLVDNDDRETLEELKNRIEVALSGLEDKE